mgnify:FL=1
MAIKTYDAISEALRAAMIQPETIMVEKEEFEQAQAAAAEQAAAAAEGGKEDPNQNPAVIAAQVRLEAAKLDADSRLQVAEIQRETELVQMAQQFDIKVEDLRTRLGIEEMKIGHKERVVAAEAAMEEELRRQGGEPKGSGGYISQ